MRGGVADTWVKGLVCNRFSVFMVLYVKFWTKVINRKKEGARIEKIKELIFKVLCGSFEATVHRG